MTPKNPPAIVKPAPITQITIGGHTYPALLCDTPATRHRGLAYAPATSRVCCIMIWHHRPRKGRTLGAQHLHQPYYIFQLTTTTQKAIETSGPIKLLPRHTQTIPLYGDKRPALIEIPSTDARNIEITTTLYGHPSCVPIGTAYYPGRYIISQTRHWPQIIIHWHIPHKDSQHMKPATKPKPNEPQ